VSVLPPDGTISLARGIPSPELLPVDELETCAAAAIARDGRIALNYGPPGGYAPLREWVAARHAVEPSQVLLTPGSMLALTLLIAETVRAGTRVRVESPTYDRTLKALRLSGAELVVDGAAEVRYVLPTFHNPTGRTLTATERVTVVDEAIAQGTLLIEDDPYGLLRFEGAQPPSLHRLLHERGAGELAVYCSSFSKSVAPGLRVGYLVLPPVLAARVEARALATYVSPPLLPQAQLFEFLDRGLLEPHLARATGQLRERRDALADALAEHLPGATWSLPDGGYFIWVELPVPSAELLAGAQAVGVTFELGSSFSPDGREERAARLAFSFETPERIREAVARLGRVLADQEVSHGA
jgi:DNA-binding transcriptional MocR family regulator